MNLSSKACAADAYDAPWCRVEAESESFHMFRRRSAPSRGREPRRASRHGPDTRLHRLLSCVRNQGLGLRRVQGLGEGGRSSIWLRFRDGVWSDHGVGLSEAPVHRWLAGSVFGKASQDSRLDFSVDAVQCLSTLAEDLRWDTRPWFCLFCRGPALPECLFLRIESFACAEMM